MNEPDILYPAIFVFTMLLIGLALTVWEFSRIKKRAQPVSHGDRHVAALTPEKTGNRAAQASSR
jgi:hypothetical protein